MADPSAPAAAAPIAATGAKSALSGATTAATLPLDPITMGVGLVAALVALLHIAPPPGQDRTSWRIFALVVGSGFLAGVFVPVAVAGGINYLPWLQHVGSRPLDLAAAALIGAAPHVLPLLWRAWREQKGGAQ